MEESYFNPFKITIREIEKSLAKDFIIKNHYTHKFSLCQVAYGIFYITDIDNQFVDGKEEKLIGCIIYGQPVGRSAALSISKLIKIDEVLELTRLFIYDGYGRNIESYCISQSFKLLKRDFSHIKAIISYSDVEQGHRGTIYQAGFLYQGNSSLCLMPNFSISLTKTPYKWLHSRTVFSQYGSHNIEHLKKRIGVTFYRKKEATKHRYVYFLCNKIEKKKILNDVKHPWLPYPKDANYNENIEEIVVENKNNMYFEC